MEKRESNLADFHKHYCEPRLNLILKLIKNLEIQNEIHENKTLELSDQKIENFGWVIGRRRFRSISSFIKTSRSRCKI